MYGADGRQESPFGLLVENVKEYAIFMLDPRGYVTTWNAGAERIKQYRADEIIGRHFARFYVNEDVENKKPEKLLEIARSNGECKDEGWRLRKGGSRFWAHVVITPLFSRTGTLQGYAKVTRDLTDQQYSKQQALLAELGHSALRSDHLKTLYNETMSCITKALKTDTCALFRPLPGKTALLLEAGTGWPSDALGRALIPAGSNSHPGFTLQSERPIVSDNMGAEARFAVSPLLRNAGVKSGVAVLVPGSGRAYGVLGVYSKRLRHFTESDTLFLQSVAHVLGTAIDRRRTYNELADANKTLATLVHSAPIGIVAYDGQGRIREWNPAAEQLYQWRAEDVIGRRDPSTEVENAVDEMLASRDLHSDVSTNSIVVKRRRRDGESLDVAVAAAPITGMDGEIETFLTVHSDITNQTRFLQIAAHELRNPMAVMKALINMFQLKAKRGDSVGDIASMADVMNRELDRLSAIFDQVLAAFETQDGRFALQGKRVDLFDVVASAVHPLQHGPIGRRVILERPAASYCPVWGDAVRIQEVVRNLADNALKYSPEDRPVRISVTTKPSCAVVSVRDEGPGIPSKEMEHLFEPFFRGGNVVERPDGLGLGLFICRDIIERHGGKLWVESDARGTTFSFDLPLDQVNASELLESRRMTETEKVGQVAGIAPKDLVRKVKGVLGTDRLIH